MPAESPRLLQDLAAVTEEARAVGHREGYAQGHAEGLARGREEGLAQGREEGLAQGRAEAELLRRQAELELERARAEAEALRQKAEAEARATVAEAEARAQALLAAAREQADRLVAEAREEQRRRLDEAQEAIVELAVAAATRIVEGHLAVRPESIVRMVATGLRRLKDTHCTVRVSPQDLPLLEAQRMVLERELGAGLLNLVADPALVPGSYMVSSQAGQVDGRLDQQAAHLKAALTAALGG